MKHGVIGVTGLPCAGKSLAAGLLADGGITGCAGLLLKADDIGHSVLARPEVESRLQERFGEEIFAENDAAAVRRAIAGRVFADAASLAWLEGLVHPLVTAEVDRLTSAAIGRQPVIVEAALLFAASLDKRCDRILLVEADFAVRARRARKRGWDRDELERRECRLRPLFEAATRNSDRKKLLRVRNDDDDGRLGERIRAALGSFQP